LEPKLYKSNNSGTKQHLQLKAQSSLKPRAARGFNTATLRAAFSATLLTRRVPVSATAGASAAVSLRRAPAAPGAVLDPGAVLVPGAARVPGAVLAPSAVALE
jgi:hypothetical protein